MSFGNNQQALEQRRYLKHGDIEISERAFNLIIGGVLAWGFFLNYIMVALFGNQIAYFAAAMNPFLYLIVYIVLVLIRFAISALTSLTFLPACLESLLISFSFFGKNSCKGGSRSLITTGSSPISLRIS